VQPDDPTGPSLKKQLEEQERRRNAGGDGGGLDAADAASDGCGSCDGTPGCDLPDCDGCDGCDGCDLLLFVRLSSLLFVVAAVVPERGGATVVRALLRFYGRRLTRFTPTCPSTPSCSAYATAAVESLGARRGLTAAARRVRDCGSAGHPATEHHGARMPGRPPSAGPMTPESAPQYRTDRTTPGRPPARPRASATRIS